MNAYYADAALLPTGWQDRVRIEVDARGNIASVRADASAEGAERLAGPVMPGMANLHSHAFQRAMAGLAESRGTGHDDFWTWRELMYRFVARLTPEKANAIARFLYVDMLRHGYTTVAEFHYVHRNPHGKPYLDPAEMSIAHVAAARETGIAITLLPSLYSHANFGGLPLSAHQQRFRSDPAGILGIVAGVHATAAGDPDVRAGVAPHSLRATDLAGLQELVAGLAQIDALAPIHIHAAEQTREVEDCVAFSGARPVQWLLEHLPIDRRWCVVHATHLTTEESAGLAHSGAVAGLCPTTEANLGDGVFAMPEYRHEGGRYGIGGDSHVSRSPFEELRLLEYVQRLMLRRRNVNAGAISPSTGTTLWLEAASGGAQAVGRAMGALAPGLRADLVVLDADNPDLTGRTGGQIADAAIFAISGNPVRDVMVGGQWRIRERCHALDERAARDYARTVRELLA